MWVKLAVHKVIDGEKHWPGDWADVDERTARRWLAGNEILVPQHRAKALVPTGSGILASQHVASVEQLAKRFDLDHEIGPPGLPFKKTLIWNVAEPLRPELVPVGFGLLETWQMVVPLRSYDTLAANVGTEAERARTLAVIHDLRVPVYNSNVIFACHSEETEVLLRRWTEEGPGDLAFLRALYITKPTILALPPIWIQEA